MYSNRYEELYHHGIKGMAWGKRRWQNPDGSLTPEGYIHYGYGQGEKKHSGLFSKKDKNTDPNKETEVEETDDYKMTTKTGSDGKPHTSYETKKAIGYSEGFFKGDQTKIGQAEFVNDKKYTAKQINDAINKCFELTKTNKDNIKDIENSIDSADDIWDSYDPKRHSGLNAVQSQDGKWHIESFYTPKYLMTGEDDQPWWSSFETDDLFNPTYCKYKGGGVV